MTDEEIAIWNRACKGLRDTTFGPGDAALAALLRIHNSAMNGGLFHSCEIAGASHCAAAIAGLRFLGLDEIALLVERAAQLPEEDADELDERYFALIPKDSVITEVFLRKRAESPDVFAPIN